MNQTEFTGDYWVSIQRL